MAQSEFSKKRQAERAAERKAERRAKAAQERAEPGSKIQKAAKTGVLRSTISKKQKAINDAMGSAGHNRSGKYGY